MSDKRNSTGSTVAERPGKYVKQKGDIAAATRYARQLFTLGNGDGKPVRNVAKLAAMAGVHIATIERRMPEWERESREIAAAETAGKCKLAARVTPDSVRWQGDVVADLKEQIDSLRALLKTLPVGADAHADCLRLLRDTVKQWETSSGFAAYADLQSTIAKEQIKLAARAQKNGDSDADQRKVSGFTFNVQPQLADSAQSDDDDLIG